MKTETPQGTAERVRLAALDILEREGPAGVSMRRVAAAVGITPMAIYYHFGNREELLRTVAEAEFEQLLDVLAAQRLRGSTEDRLVRLMRKYVDYALARPRIFDYIFTGVRPDARRYPRDFRARRSPTLNRIADVVAEMIDDKQLRPDDVWEVALTLWAHVHGFVMLFRAGRFQLTEKAFHALLRRSLRRLIHGLNA